MVGCVRALYSSAILRTCGGICCRVWRVVFVFRRVAERGLPASPTCTSLCSWPVDSSGLRTRLRSALQQLQSLSREKLQVDVVEGLNSQTKHSSNTEMADRSVSSATDPSRLFDLHRQSAQQA